MTIDAQSALGGFVFGFMVGVIALWFFERKAKLP